MPSRPVLLLDVDRVILDNERWEEESARLGGPALASLLGGDPGAWAAHQEEERVDVAERTTIRILDNTEAVFPGAAGAIEKLSGQFEIHMASGNPSFVVEAVLPRLGVSDRVGRPFGSDLVGCQKGDSRFYPAILEAVGAVPSRTIMVDDGEEPLASARAAGLRTVKVGGAAFDGSDLTVGSLAELPDVISEVVESTGTETE